LIAGVASKSIAPVVLLEHFCITPSHGYFPFLKSHCHEVKNNRWVPSGIAGTHGYLAQKEQ
jgi:hypothetical protein